MFGKTWAVLGAGFIAAAISVRPATALPIVTSGTLVIELDASTNVNTVGSSVSSWIDQTGASDGYGGPFSAGGTAPTLVPNDINGRPAIRFTGNGWLAGNTPSTHTEGDSMLDYSFFFVTANTTNPKGLFDTASGQSNPIRFINDNRVADQTNDSGGIPVALNGSGATLFDFTHDGNVGANTRTWSGYIDGSSYTGSTNTESSSRRVAWQDPAIGAINFSATPASFFTGDVAEVLVYSGVLSTQDRQSIENNLISEYGIVPEPVTLSLLALPALLLPRRSQGAGKKLQR